MGEVPHRCACHGRAHDSVPSRILHTAQYLDGTDERRAVCARLSRHVPYWPVINSLLLRLALRRHVGIGRARRPWRTRSWSEYD